MKSIARKTLVLVTAAAVLSVPAGAHAAAVFFGPTPYLSTADIPANLYAGGPAFLEDFEDGSLDGGITASAGAPLGPGGSTDSVDGDDGAIDGSGIAGNSFFSGSGFTGIRFTFTSVVTAAAVVWTDGAGNLSFEAFDDMGNSVGGLGPISNPPVYPDNSFSGTTGEDRFFGVKDVGGIKSIFISNSAGGIEVDHVQYGRMADGSPSPIPLPAGLPLLAGALGLGGWIVRRRKS